MTKIAKVSLTIVLGSGMLLAGANQMKMYDVKSGKIEYGIKGSGEIMGQKMQTIGKKRVIFDAYGAKNLTEENKIDKQTIMGQKKITKTHTMTYMKEGMAYHVDFKAKRIMRMGNMAASMGALMGGGKNMKQSGEDMMKQMGGKKTGTDNVLGYTCDVWDLMGTKQCIYKGIPLRVETNIMGIKNIEVATKAEFDISLSKDDFKLPDFPIYNMDPSQPIENQKPLDKSKLDAMDAKDNAEAKVKSKEAAEAMKGMAAGMTALTESGFDMSSNKEMTPEQEQIMQKAMMKAMGGEGKILAKMKNEILGDAEGIEFAHECFGDANTVKEANKCVDKGNKMFNEDEEYLTSWTASEKNEMLQEIEQFKQSIPCIKTAQTMEDMRKCMPQEQKENKIKIAILSILLSAGLWADSAALFGKVMNVSENDTLNVRSQPSYRAKKVAELPAEAYVGIEKCQKVKRSTWCRVYPLVQQWYEKFGNDSHIGWVNARYLKFNNRGYVLIKGKKNCAYCINCTDGKCEVVLDYEINKEHVIVKLQTELIERNLLRGESSFGVTPDNVDGVCNTGMFIEDYLKKLYKV